VYLLYKDLKYYFKEKLRGFLKLINNK